MKQERIDELLKDTVYKHAIGGQWETNYDPDDEEQMEAIIGVQECGWGMYVPVCEIDCNTTDQTQVEATVYVVKDAKLNAARVQLLAKALIRLRDCDFVIKLPDRMDAVRDIARDALKEAGLEG